MVYIVKKELKQTVVCFFFQIDPSFHFLSAQGEVSKIKEELERGKNDWIRASIFDKQSSPIQHSQ